MSHLGREPECCSHPFTHLHIVHTPYDPGLSPFEALLLKECMTSLSEEERQIFVLHALSGLKHREIGKLLDLPLSTVLSKYNRAIKKIQKKFG